MGPTLLIHLPVLLTRDEIEALHNWLSRTTYSLTRERDEWDFYTDNDTCLCSLAIVPFGAESAGNGKVTGIYLEQEKIVEYEKRLGYLPSVSFQLDNYCRSDQKGHKQLAKMAILLGRKHGGVIEVGSAVDEIVSGAKSRGKQLPGSLYVLTYSDVRSNYLVDADFMEWWVEQGEFHLEI